MLEAQELAILPWSGADELVVDGGDSIARVRRIVDAQSGHLLGFASGQAPRWWRGTTVRVHEREDASLLLTLSRPWGPFRMWRVHDADERLIGTFYGNYLFDGMGYLLACLHEDADAAGKFVTRAGLELGSCRSRADGACCLSFANTPDSSPFARMLLLGKMLSLQKVKSAT